MTDVIPHATAPVAFAFDSHAVRTITEDDGSIWFVARDICAILGVTNHRNAFARLDDDQKGVRTMDTLGGLQEMVTVNESGLYALVLTSRKPEAKQFARWVTGEVLPAIRRQGYYGGAALAQMAQSMAHLAERVVATEEKIDAILTLVDVAGKYIALLESNQKPKRRKVRPITPEDEEKITELLAQGMPGNAIAEHLGISTAAVSLIKNGLYKFRKEGSAA